MMVMVRISDRWFGSLQHRGRPGTAAGTPVTWRRASRPEESADPAGGVREDRHVTDASTTARDFVHQRYPSARAAYLGGSAATGGATSTSDLDVFVLLGEADGDISYVETTTHHGWLVEAFVYTPAAAQRLLEQGRAQRRPVLDSLIARGIALTDTAEAAEWAQHSRRVLAAGPPEADASDLDGRRYMLSALLDDLAGEPGPAERYVVEADAFRVAAELVLLLERQWLGTGKWLVRNLRDRDDHGLLAWADGARDPSALVAVCRRVLDAAGGYLQDGYVRGDRPTPPPR
jgi:predicted nucleotidyltransferase